MKTNYDINDLTNILFSKNWTPERWCITSDQHPYFIRDAADSLTLELELPRFTKEQVNVDVEGDRLIVTAERLDHDKVVREFTIGEQLDTSAASAELRDGVLYVTLPKKIQVQRHTLVLK